MTQLSGCEKSVTCMDCALLRVSNFSVRFMVTSWYIFAQNGCAA